jgi:hypothetical protein
MSSYFGISGIEYFGSIVRKKSELGNIADLNDINDFVLHPNECLHDCSPRHTLRLFNSAEKVL